MKIRVYTQNEQAKGHFGDGEIVENKPIGFPHEGSVVKRVGPLFTGRGQNLSKRSRFPCTRIPASKFCLTSCKVQSATGTRWAICSRSLRAGRRSCKQAQALTMPKSWARIPRCSRSGLSRTSPKRPKTRRRTTSMTTSSFRPRRRMAYG